jgi:AraC-like DNA-binding protein
MPYITDKDFKKLAEAVADDLVQGSIPLNNSITKLAKSMDMSQDQIRRLCEATNNVTFNKMFNSRDKTAADRMIEFPVADSKVVLASLIDSVRGEDCSEKTAAYELRELENEMDLVRRPDAEVPAMEKQAFELRPVSRPKREADARTLGKVAEHMRNEKLATDMQYSDALSELKGRFKRLYDVPPFEQFEKDAERAAQLAVTALHVDHVTGPEREFAATLLRNTKGARAAAAAWRHALKSR